MAMFRTSNGKGLNARDNGLGVPDLTDMVPFRTPEIGTSLQPLPERRLVFHTPSGQNRYGIQTFKPLLSLKPFCHLFSPQRGSHKGGCTFTKITVAKSVTGGDLLKGMTGRPGCSSSRSTDNEHVGLVRFRRLHGFLSVRSLSRRVGIKRIGQAFKGLGRPTRRSQTGPSLKTSPFKKLKAKSSGHA